jgi:hypothetical protein
MSSYQPAASLCIAGVDADALPTLVQLESNTVSSALVVCSTAPLKPSTRGSGNCCVMLAVYACAAAAHLAANKCIAQRAALSKSKWVANCPPCHGHDANLQQYLAHCRNMRKTPSSLVPTQT